jgi:hypothetical protein
MKIKEIFSNLKNKLFNKTKKLPEQLENNDYYSKFTKSINDIGLIEMFEKQLPQNLKTIIDNSKGNIYNKPLSTQISGEQLIPITRDFFDSIDSEISVKINSILDGKDNRFNLNINPNGNGENKVSNPNRIPINIDVTQFGDLRDVYGIVHELTHCLDIENGDTAARRILGEVAPQCMERMLDVYLIENCDSLGFNSEILLKDIEKRKFTTFISRAQNAIHFNNLRNSNYATRNFEQEKDSRYVLAQIYQTQLMKNDNVQAKNKLVEFINCVKNNDFDGANSAFEMEIEHNNIKQREENISNTIKDAEEIYNYIKSRKSEFENIESKEWIEINDPIELTNFGERAVKNTRKQDIVYSSEFSNDEDGLQK